MVNKQKNKQTKKKLPARMELDGERPVRQAKKEVNFGTSGKLWVKAKIYIPYKEKESKKQVHVGITESLCYTPEPNTTL